MADREALLALAERVEQASGPDRELDALIWCALHGVKYRGHHEAYASYGLGNPETQVEFTEPPKRTRMVSGNVLHPHAKPVTTSLDAAMGLVPEGWTIQVSDWDHPKLRERGPWQAILVPLGKRGDLQHTFDARCDHAATPALALTAAALRARAQMEEDHVG